MLINVTQYMRPDGHTKPQQVEIPDKYKSVIDKLNKLDLRITCESLTNGLVAQYISHEEGDFAIELSFPGEKSHQKLLEMLDAFDEDAFKRWLTTQIEGEQE